MASGLMKLVLSITGRDDGAKRLLAETEQQLKRTAAAKERMAKTGRAYEIAGIRSERAIQREIKMTEAAYNRLKRSGTASHNDLVRAATAHKQRIKELNAELGKGASLQKGMSVGAAALAGGAAAYGAVKPAVERYKEIDTRLRETTWAAHGESGKSTEWLEKVGMAQTKELIKALVAKNGGNVDLAIDTVQGMLANGADWQTVQKDAAATHRMALASGENGQYDGKAAAKLAKVFSDNGLDVAKASNMAMISGMQGNFEIADMVRELPSLLPDAKAAGFTGEAGLAYLLSALQSSANKTGSTSEAANNVKNALQKALSADTTKRMDKLAKQHGGQDWQAMVLAGQKEGKNAMQVMGDFAQKMLAQDKQYQEAKKRADAGDDAARQEMATMQAFLVNRLLPDMQARGGLNAMLDDKQMAEYFAGLQNIKIDAVAQKNEFMSNGAAARQEQQNAQAEMKRQDSLDGIVEAETAFKGLAAEFPNATLALQALAAAATAAALAQGVMGMAGGGGLGGAKAALGTAARFGAVGLGAAAGGLAAWDANSRINRNQGKGFTEGGIDSRAAGYAESALGGAAVGAAIGSIIPGIGTAIGAAIGGAGGLLTAAIADAWKEDPPAKPAGMAAEPVQTQQVQAPPPEPLAPVIGQQTAAYQAAISAQTAAYQAAVAADTAAVSSGLDTVNATLSSVSQTINNNMTVNLDGRVIANEVARYQVQMFGRGAGQ